jgi:hypothetical protein
VTVSAVARNTSFLDSVHPRPTALIAADGVVIGRYATDQQAGRSIELRRLGLEPRGAARDELHRSRGGHYDVYAGGLDQATALRIGTDFLLRHANRRID